MEKESPESVPVMPVNSDCGCLVKYPGLSAICQPDGLADKVLHGEIPIEILDFSSVVLKHQFALEYGLLVPSRVYAHTVEGRPIPTTDCIPSNCTAVQMHFVPGHYILSYQFMTNIIVYL